VKVLRGRDTDSFQAVLYGRILRNFKHKEHLILSRYLNTLFAYFVFTNIKYSARGFM